MRIKLGQKIKTPVKEKKSCGEIWLSYRWHVVGDEGIVRREPLLGSTLISLKKRKRKRDSKKEEKKGTTKRIKKIKKGRRNNKKKNKERHNKEIEKKNEKRWNLLQIQTILLIQLSAHEFYAAIISKWH